MNYIEQINKVNENIEKEAGNRPKPARPKDIGLPTVKLKKGQIEEWERAGRPDPRKYFLEPCK